MIVAPVLHDIAASVSRRDRSEWRQDPMRWAYDLREAVSMVHPSWVVSHHDDEFEADAIAQLADGPDDVWDVEVGGDGPFAPGLTLARTLSQLDTSWTVAASVTGPLRVARSLAARWGCGDEMLDDLREACGDVIAALVAAYGDVGVTEILVWEPDADELPDQAAAAHAAITRRAALAGARLTLGATPDIDGYARRVGSGVHLVAAHTARDPDAWRAAVGAAAPDAVVLTDGPVPRDTCADALVSLVSR